MPFIRINNCDYFYSIEGHASETIIFAHELMLNSQMFSEVITSLKDKYRCVSFDFRGQGQSEKVTRGLSLDNLVLDVELLLKHLDISHCHFVGLSMGGYVGIKLAAKNKGLIKTLTLLNSSAL